MSPGADRRCRDGSRNPDRSGDSPRAPRRKRVVLADRRHTRQVGRTLVELEEQTSVGEALVRHLVRVQLRSSLILASITFSVLCGLPLVFWAVPQISDTVVLGIHLPWLLLGVMPFPFLLFIGFLSTRMAERHESDFVHMVER